jgi:hypothetical protein
MDLQTSNTTFRVVLLTLTVMADAPDWVATDPAPSPPTTDVDASNAADFPKYKDWCTIPRYYRRHGYTAVTGSKTYHQPHGRFSDPIAWDQQYSTETGTPYPPEAGTYRHGMRDLSGNKIV